ncbi:AfsR/SARP family transcriptional regulator [Actinospica robiniae]|uniref:AfsR/SARP family transcriptional regulator n=1 Tax=Actinospica robiniae TaxID=304901 RepID=UPI000404DBA1|nr:AfsR/SARP family transcriptional regulator [Actinospica robiniae]
MRFGLLGTVFVHDDVVERRISSLRQRTLLAALLLEPNRVASLSRLADLVWNTDPPACADTTLHSYAMRLRRALGPAAAARILTRSPGYLAVVHDAELDVAQFEGFRTAARRHSEAGAWDQARASCVAALALWRGDPLADLDPPAAWSEEIHRLQEARLQTVEARIEADLQLGAHAAVVTDLAGLMAEHPFRETPATQMMLALYRTGRQSEALAVYQRVRALLSSEIGVEPGPALRNLHERILDADPSLEHRGRAAPIAVTSAPAPTASAAPAAPSKPDVHDEQYTAPAQLPAATADFSGREDDARLIAKLLDPDDEAPRILVVTGPGGVGKTALAVHVANRLRSRFPDGQLFASMAGVAADAVSPADVQRGFLAALGTRTEAQPADAAHLTGAYRSATSGRRLLILLDDVSDSKDVRDLVPTGPGSAVVVTSRTSLAGIDGATTVELEGLTEAESRQLLARLAGEARVAAEPEAVDAVARACAGLPLAVRIVGTRLAARPAWPIRHLADRLADERGRLDALASGDLDVRACFEVGFEQLEAAAVSAPVSALDPATALCLLSLWSGTDLSLPAAAALLGRRPAETECVLERLVDRHMVESPAAGRYRLHDLLRVFAAEQAQARLDEQVRGDAVERVVAWYAHAVYTADLVATPQRRRMAAEAAPSPPDVGFERVVAWYAHAVYTADLVATPQRRRMAAEAAPLPPDVGFESRSDALAWVDFEHLNVCAAASHALAIGAFAHAWRIAVAAWGPMSVRRRWEPLLGVHRHGLTAARAAADRLAEAWVLNGIGTAYIEMQKLGEAEDVLCQALVLRQSIDDPAGEALTLNNLGVLAYRREDMTEAVGFLERSLALQVRVGDLPGQAMTLSNLGQIVPLAGRPDKALGYLTAAMAIRIEVGDVRGTGMTAHGIGAEYLRGNQAAEAVSWFEQGLAKSLEADDFHTQALIRLDLGRALIASDRGPAARAHLEEACRLFHMLGDEHIDEAETLLHDC